MTMQEFNTLEKHKQHRYLLKNGVFLDSYETDEFYIVLFKLDNYFVEVCFDVHCTKIIQSKIFKTQRKSYHI